MNGIILFYGFLLLLLMFLSNSASGEYWNETNFFNDFQTRRDGRKLRPHRNNLFTFDTKENNIEVAFEFSVPFISIPVKRSIDAVKNTVMGPLANFNSGAIVFAGAMVLAGAIASFMWRTFSLSKNQPTATDEDSASNTTKTEKSNNLGDNKMMKLMQLLETTFEKYDIEPTVCSQRLICTLSKTAAENVASGFGTSTDKILDGIFSSKWFLNRVSGTAIHDAIRASKLVNDCNKKYFGCKLKNISIENMFEIFIKNIKK